jgi:nitroreductase
MKLLNTIRTRRSIKKFLDKEVPDEIIKKIIDSARYAPSSQNSQPWEFVIIKNKETKRKLAELKGKENEECILESKFIVAVCVDKKRSERRWIEDGVCAVTNILLTAHDLGLGAVYVTGYSISNPEITEQIKKILKLPESVIPVVLIPIGYPDPSEKIEKKQLRRIDEMIHYEKW